MIFKASDLNLKFLKARAKAEAEEIYKGSEASRKGRSLMQIFESCLYGQAAEVYLIEKEGFTDNPEQYKDVFNPEGKEVEVKVTSLPKVKAKLIECKNNKWRISDILYIFIGDFRTGEYSLHGIYHWDTTTKQFILQNAENVV
jgi:hypothetical protein